MTTLFSRRGKKYSLRLLLAKHRVSGRCGVETISSRTKNLREKILQLQVIALVVPSDALRP